MRWLMLVLILLLSGCASDGTYTSGLKSGDSVFLLPYGDDNSKAPGDAWTGSGMFPRKGMVHHGREPANDWDFYYKHCSMNGDENYYSKTSYDCTGPLF